MLVDHLPLRFREGRSFSTIQIVLLVLLMLGSFAAGGVPVRASETGAIVPVRGIVRASLEAKLSTSVAARTEAIGFKAGEEFKAGDILIKFDCSEDEARLAAAEAHLEEKAVAYRSAKYLLAKNAGNKQDVEIARAQQRKAGAEANVIRARLAQCSLVAPYDGYVSALNVNLHEIPSVGEPIVAIVHNRDPSIELIVPSSWLNWVKAGVSFHFMVDETGEAYRGKVDRVGAVVDAVSQTVKLYGKFERNDLSVLPGMSGTAIFPYDAVN